MFKHLAGRKELADLRAEPVKAWKDEHVTGIRQYPYTEQCGAEWCLERRCDG